MVISSGTPLRGLLLASFLLQAGPAVGQQAPVLVRYPLRLVELSVLADSSYGLELVVLPAADSERGKDGAPIWLRFEPDSVLGWLNRAAAALRFPAAGGPTDVIQWSPTLHPFHGPGGFLLGRHRKKGALQKDHWLAVADSTPGWLADIAAQEADSILHLFLALAGQARLDTSTSAALDASQVDQAASVVLQPKPRGRGRLVVQYIVGTDGRVEPASVLVLAASSAELEREALAQLQATAFAPARRGGQPVRQVVRQVMVSR